MRGSAQFTLKRTKKYLLKSENQQEIPQRRRIDYCESKEASFYVKMIL